MYHLNASIVIGTVLDVFRVLKNLNS